MENLTISDDKSKLDIALIHKFLTTSYWGKGRTIHEVKNSIEHSVCFGVYKDEKQIGFARIVTDYTLIAYLMDVFILEEFRGKGYSKILLKRILDDDKFKGVKKWTLATKDAHSLYSKFGFEKIKNPDRLMEKVKFRK
jgi:N-acetylglutamate synthase-like GNAT family acetyltransferase